MRDALEVGAGREGRLATLGDLLYCWSKSGRLDLEERRETRRAPVRLPALLLLAYFE